MHIRGFVLPGGEERDLFITADGRMTFTPLEGATTVAVGLWLIPGFVDMHSHLEIKSPASPDAEPDELVRASARAELEAGVLAVREPGSPSYASRGLGPHEGLPRTITAGRFLAPPGGYIPGLARAIAPDQLADEAVDELSRTDGWVKVIGDWAQEGAMQANFDDDQLAGAAAAVHRAGGRIAIHTTLPRTALVAATAGFDTIEHGIGVDEPTISAMLRGAVAWVPTLGILPFVPEVMAGRGMPRAALDELDRQIQATRAAVRTAVEAGVRVLAGTDAGMVEHGSIGEEIGWLSRVGMTSEQALAAGSWEARAYLGLPGLDEGAPADIVGFRRDPREPPLPTPDLVVLDGRVLQAPAN